MYAVSWGAINAYDSRILTAFNNSRAKSSYPVSVQSFEDNVAVHKPRVVFPILVGLSGAFRCVIRPLLQPVCKAPRIHQSQVRF